MSLPCIGRYFGKRDHTTVMHAIKTVERLIATDTEFAADVASLREELA
jgi:chromosomal replication initiator protein